MVSLTFNYLPNYHGKGTVSLVGYGGGEPIGDLLDPVECALGSIVMPAEFFPDSTGSVTFSIRMTSDLECPQVSALAVYDSLAIDGRMWPIYSREVTSVLGPSLLYIPGNGADLVIGLQGGRCDESRKSSPF